MCERIQASFHREIDEGSRAGAAVGKDSAGGSPKAGGCAPPAGPGAGRWGPITGLVLELERASTPRLCLLLQAGRVSHTSL